MCQQQVTKEVEVEDTVMLFRRFTASYYELIFMWHIRRLLKMDEIHYRNGCNELDLNGGMEKD